MTEPVGGVGGRFERWIDATCVAPQLFWFRRVFAAVWLVYDAADIAFKGTATSLDWFAAAHGSFSGRLLALQVICLLCELVIVVARPSMARFVPLACLGAAGARFVITRQYWSLNDFLFFVVVMLLLAFVPGRADAAGPLVPRWLVDVLRWQAAWVYIATGILKANREFLSGGHLFVRHGYLRFVRHWPYGPFGSLVTSLWVDVSLAWFTVVAEVAVGVLLLLVPRWRRAGLVAVLLAVAIHGGAAAFDNVWFFGVAMFSLVWCVRRPIAGRMSQ